jgi:hypothetical protein
VADTLSWSRRDDSRFLLPRPRVQAGDQRRRHDSWRGSRWSASAPSSARGRRHGLYGTRRRRRQGGCRRPLARVLLWRRNLRRLAAGRCLRRLGLAGLCGGRRDRFPADGLHPGHRLAAMAARPKAIAPQARRASTLAATPPGSAGPGATSGSVMQIVVPLPGAETSVMRPPS